MLCMHAVKHEDQKGNGNLYCVTCNGSFLLNVLLSNAKKCQNEKCVGMRHNFQNGICRCVAYNGKEWNLHV